MSRPGIEEGDVSDYFSLGLDLLVIFVILEFGDEESLSGLGH